MTPLNVIIIAIMIPLVFWGIVAVHGATQRVRSHGKHWNAPSPPSGCSSGAAGHPGYIRAGRTASVTITVIGTGGAGFTSISMGGSSGGGAYTCDDSIEDAGIRAGEIIAWRVWRVLEGRLYSAFVAQAWEPGQVMKGDPKTAGVHAFKERKRAILEYAHASPIVIGKVALWGEVIEHEMGYRAEFAQIESLEQINGETDVTLADLRKLYCSPR